MSNIYQRALLKEDDITKAEQLLTRQAQTGTVPHVQLALAGVDIGVWHNFQKMLTERMRPFFDVEEPTAEPTWHALNGHTFLVAINAHHFRLKRLGEGPDMAKLVDPQGRPLA